MVEHLLKYINLPKLAKCFGKNEKIDVSISISTHTYQKSIKEVYIHATSTYIDRSDLKGKNIIELINNKLKQACKTVICFQLNIFKCFKAKN